MQTIGDECNVEHATLNTREHSAALDAVCRRSRVCTTRRSSTTPAASASSWTSRAANRTGSCSRACRSSTNLDHRGACGSEVNTGDGAGVLLQMPHRFLVEAVQEGAHRVARARRVRLRHRVPAAQSDAAPAHRRALRADRAVRRPDRARLAHGADQQLDARRHREVVRAVHAAGVHRPQSGRSPTSWRSSASSTSSASAPTARSAPRRWKARRPGTSPACRTRRSSTKACC